MQHTVVEHRSVVSADAADVWARVVTPEGINDELRPLLTMSVPRGAEGMTVETVPIGTPIGRSWLRLFGVIPVDYDHVTVAELEPGRRFREESTMLSMSLWRHERTVDSHGDGYAEIHDRITFRPRLPLALLAPVLAVAVRALFDHRHRRLQRFFTDPPN